MPKFNPSKYQQAVFDWVKDGDGCAIVDAVAGSGKTTTIVQALTLIPGTLATCFLAFNKSIADELKKRVPPHVSAMTLNSLGHRALLKKFGRLVKLDSYKTRNIAKFLLSYEEYDDFGEDITKLVGLCKSYGLAPKSLPHLTGLMPDNHASWRWLIDHFDIDLKEGDISHVIDLARAVLAAGFSTADNVIDFNDQLYMSVLLNAPLPKFDWLFVDEAQDVSPIQRAMLHKALKPGGRLCAVGDEKQAIYGFRGSDSQSLSNIQKEFNAVRLPLSISYRCPQSIINYAQSIVPYIESHEKAPAGAVICWPEYLAEDFNATDLIICRLTAPVIAMAYSLIARRVPVRVLGREIGQGLIRIIDKLKPKGLDGLREKLDAWRIAEREKFIAKGQDDKAEAVEDKYNTIMVFVDESGAKTVPDVKERIAELFNDKKQALTLCTVHKAKGLEAPRVFVLEPDLMPSKWARQAWQVEQEHNLMYVAYTRAMSELIFIRQDDLAESEVKKAVNQ